MAWSTLNNFSFYLNFIHSIRSLRFFQLSFKHNANEHEVAHSIQFTHFNSNAFTAAFFSFFRQMVKTKFFFLSIMPSLLNAHAILFIRIHQPFASYFALQSPCEDLRSALYFPFFCQCKYVLCEICSFTVRIIFILLFSACVCVYFCAFEPEVFCFCVWIEF